MKKTLTEQDIQDNPLLADCAVGDVLSVDHGKKKGDAKKQDDSTDPDKPQPPKP